MPKVKRNPATSSAGRGKESRFKVFVSPARGELLARELENSSGCPVSMSKKARVSTPADDEKPELWRKHGLTLYDDMANLDDRLTLVRVRVRVRTLVPWFSVF